MPLGKQGGRHGRLGFALVDRPRTLTMLDQLRPLAQAKNAAVAQLALAWLLHQPVASSVLGGATKPEQPANTLRAVVVQ